MCSDVLLENLPMWIQFVDRSGRVWGIVQNLSHWGKTICSRGIQCLNPWASTVVFFFSSFMYMFTAMFLLMLHLKCVWTCGPLGVWIRHRIVEHVFISNNNQSPAADSWFGSERDLVHPNYRHPPPPLYILTYCLELSHVDFEFICTFYIGDFFHHNHCCDWTMSSERKLSL